MATTLNQIDTAVLGHLNLPSNESVYGETLRNQIENDVQNELFAEEFLAPWKNKKYLFATAVRTTITAAITTASTSIVIGDATGWPTSGTAYIEGDIITFSGRTTTTLTGVTNIDISHAASSTIHPLYPLPSDFGAQIQLTIDQSEQNYVSEFDLSPFYNADINAVDRHAISYLGNSFFMGNWTTVVDKNGVEYILLSSRSTSQPAILHYRKIPAAMTSSQAASIPDEWAIKVIAPIAAGRLLIERGDDENNLGTLIMNQGLRRKFEMKKYYASRMGGFRKRFGIAHNYKAVKNF